MSDLARSSEKISQRELRDSLEPSQEETLLAKRVKTIQCNLENHLSRSIEAKDRQSQNNSTCKRQHTYLLAPSINRYSSPDPDSPQARKPQIEENFRKNQVQENLRKATYQQGYEKTKDRLFHKFLFNRLLQKIQIKTKFVFNFLRNFNINLKHFCRVLGLVAEANRIRKIGFGFAGLRGWGVGFGVREKLLGKVLGEFGGRKKGEVWRRLMGEVREGYKETIRRLRDLEALKVSEDKRAGVGVGEVGKGFGEVRTQTGKVEMVEFGVGPIDRQLKELGVQTLAKILDNFGGQTELEKFQRIAETQTAQKLLNEECSQTEHELIMPQLSKNDDDTGRTKDLWPSFNHSPSFNLAASEPQPIRSPQIISDKEQLSKTTMFDKSFLKKDTFDNLASLLLFHTPKFKDPYAKKKTSLGDGDGVDATSEYNFD
jgi:hypothetical protein